MSSLIHPFQHFSRNEYVWCSGKYDENVSLGGRTIINLRFADDIDAFAEEEQGLEALVESRQNLDKE